MSVQRAEVLRALIAMLDRIQDAFPRHDGVQVSHKLHMPYCIELRNTATFSGVLAAFETSECAIRAACNVGTHVISKVSSGWRWEIDHEVLWWEVVVAGVCRKK
jgi:hypothetical protein